MLLHLCKIPATNIKVAQKLRIFVISYNYIFLCPLDFTIFHKRSLNLAFKKKKKWKRGEKKTNWTRIVQVVQSTRLSDGVDGYETCKSDLNPGCTGSDILEACLEWSEDSGERSMASAGQLIRDFISCRHAVGNSQRRFPVLSRTQSGATWKWRCNSEKYTGPSLRNFNVPRKFDLTPRYNVLLPAQKHRNDQPENITGVYSYLRTVTRANRFTIQNDLSKPIKWLTFIHFGFLRNRLRNCYFLRGYLFREC